MNADSTKQSLVRRSDTNASIPGSKAQVKSELVAPNLHAQIA